MVEIGDVDEFAGLPLDGSNYRRVTVSQTNDRYACDQIEVFLAVGIPHPRPFSTYQGDRKTRIGTGYILFGELENSLVVHALLPHYLGPYPFLGEYL